MKLSIQKTILPFLLIGAAWIVLACSKTNSNHNQMASQPIDTTTNTRDTTTKTYLALGDSYTIGQSVPLSENYPNQTISLLNNKGYSFSSPQIIATSGWTTVNLLGALAAKKNLLPSYNIVTLLIGVNNQYQGGSQSDYKTDFTTLLQQSIAYAGNNPSHVIVISIPDYSGTPFGNGRNNRATISSEIDSFNAINKEISTDYKVNYINVTDESRKAFTDNSLLASDGLHYSEKEYAIWAGLLAAQIEKILQ